MKYIENGRAGITKRLKKNKCSRYNVRKGFVTGKCGDVEGCEEYMAAYIESNGSIVEATTYIIEVTDKRIVEIVKRINGDECNIKWAYDFIVELTNA